MKRSFPLPGFMMRRSVFAAVVLGTALSTLGSNAESTASEDGLRAVGDIGRYCTACWRNARLHPDCWSDCTQDVFVRLLERVRPDSWDRILAADSEERREFLRAIDAVKKRTQRQHRYCALPDGVADPREARPHTDDRSAVDQAATEVLSPRQQQIVRLSFEGASVQEIASQLGIGPERVSDEKYKAIRKLQRHLCARQNS